MHDRRVLVAALVSVLAMLAPAGVFSAPRALASTAMAPKVVVVVGPTHSLTSQYLQWGEAIAERAESHGAQVVRVFHPHATWAAVAAAAAGANVLVYLGHGNGYPSPYTTSLMPDRQDGMGLDPVDGAAETDVQYLGEQSMATLGLAPGSVVLLNHLCYASGNSEPGQPDPTLDVAVQRVDNFAAGFIAGGASAVFALGHQDAGDIIDALFGPAQALDQLFVATGGIGTFQTTVASVRTPGARLHLDPETATGFYRSLAGNLDLATTQVLVGAGAPQPSPAPPPSAAPSPPSPPQPPTTVAAPALMSLTGASGFSPNGDGIADTLSVAYGLSEPATLDVSVLSAAGQPVRHMTVGGRGRSGRFTWDGRGDDGLVVPDGSYTILAMPAGAGTDGSPLTAQTRVLTAVRSPTASPAVFYPLDHDGLADRTTLGFTLTQPATVTWTITDSAGNAVRTLCADQATAPGTWTLPWDGTGTAAGSTVPGPLRVGTYYSSITAATGAGTLVTREPVYLMPFRITPSPATASAGASVTVSIVSSEPLAALPRLVVTQPGLAGYPVTPRAMGGSAYRAVFRLRAGTPGRVSLKLVGVDVAGGTISTATRMTFR